VAEKQRARREAAPSRTQRRAPERQTVILSRPWSKRTLPERPLAQLPSFPGLEWEPVALLAGTAFGSLPALLYFPDDGSRRVTGRAGVRNDSCKGSAKIDDCAAETEIEEREGCWIDEDLGVTLEEIRPAG
jgi:hypothetical protein